MAVQCLECKNDIPLAEENLKAGYYFECPLCGITMEIKEMDKNKNPALVIVEEEK